MISPNEIKTVRNALKPFADAGLISQETFSEIMSRISDGQEKARRPDLLTRKEAAKLMKCSMKSLENYETAGKLKAFRIGGMRLIRYHESEILKLLEE